MEIAREEVLEESHPSKEDLDSIKEGFKKIEFYYRRMEAELKGVGSSFDVLFTSPQFVYTRGGRRESRRCDSKCVSAFELDLEIFLCGN